MKKQAKDIRENDRFTYAGAFTTYRAVSNPKPDTALPDRVVFEVVNERWGVTRDKKPIGIRLAAELEVEVVGPPRKPDVLPQVIMDALHQLHAAGVGTLRIKGLAREFSREPYIVETKGRALLYRNGFGELYSVTIEDAPVEGDDVGGYRVYFGHDRRHIGRCDAYGEARGYWRSNGHWVWIAAEEGPRDEPGSWWDEMAKVCERLGKERRG